MTAIGLRLRAAFSVLVRELPASARASTSMAKYLGVSPATCQRLLESINPQRDAAQVPLRLPGPEALEQLLAGVRKRSGQGEGEARVQPETLGLARAGIEQYREFIGTYARSQRAFIALCAAQERGEVTPSGPEGPGPVQRRALVMAAAGATGESVRVKAGVMLVRPAPGAAGALAISSMAWYRGVKRREFARAFTPGVVGSWWTRGDVPAEQRPAQGPGTGTVRWSLVRELSSVEVRPVTLAADRGRAALVADFGADDDHAGDARGARGADRQGWLGPVDVALHFSGHTLVDPRSDPLARLSLAMRVSQPTGLIVHDVLLHKDLLAADAWAVGPSAERSQLAELGKPVLGAYSLSADPGDTPGSTPDNLWHERFPDETRLGLLGPMTGEAGACAAHPEQGRLIALLLEAEGARGEDYGGLRCLCEFPLWQTEYRIDFVRAAGE
jgi:hypothetical protein